MQKSLTPQKKKILDFINLYSENKGYSPSLEEIKKKLKLRSVSTIHQHVEEMRKAGHLEKNKKNQKRSIDVKYTDLLVKIPIIGTIAAGQPIEVIEDHQETISIVNPSIRNSNGYYALRVAGDSMIDEGIFDGDVVVIKKQSVAENGQTVVAIIDEDQTTLKKLYREDGRFRLQPANPTLFPIYRKEVEVRGVVAQVIRNINNLKIAPTKTKSKSNFGTIDLFAGVGGIRLGFEQAGFETVFSNDFEPNCKKTYDLNFPTSKLVVEDIRKIGIDDLPEFDFLLGGFPCQAFSIAGYRQGFKDEKGRGNLFFDIARIIEARKPQGFLLENVKNLASHDEGKTFRVIRETLEGFGYHIKYKVLNTMEYGNVPQNRERVYIVGFKNKEHSDNFSFPESVELTKKITNLLEKNVPEKYYYNGKPLFDRLKNFVREEGKVYQWRRQYVRENKSGVCPTLTANMGTGGHNVPIIKDKKGIRKLTPLECFRIQGFPKGYILPKISDSSLYKQAGNSVSVPVVEAVAKQMMKAME
ncbi:MAG: transcriptional repressor LexA [Candidatus Paceibacterota bacterium]|jgi:DNA (cytosine-5)-methyltransferase 1